VGRPAPKEAPERVLAEVAQQVAIAPEEVRAALSRWQEAGGDLAEAQALLVSGGRRGCTGACASALLHAGGDVLHAMPDQGDPVTIVLGALHEACSERLLADHAVTDLELGYALRAATARQIAGSLDGR
jgi:hypothetical protein